MVPTNGSSHPVTIQPRALRGSGLVSSACTAPKTAQITYSAATSSWSEPATCPGMISTLCVSTGVSTLSHGGRLAAQTSPLRRSGITMQTRPRIIVVGGGFAGLSAVHALRHAAADVLLIDRFNHHTFQPLLYQVATAGLAAPSIAAPLRHILRSQRNATVLLGEVRKIDTVGKSVDVDGVLHRYDFLIVATGSTHAYFGHEDWARHAPGLKTLDDALHIRARILTAFERAEAEDDPVAKRALLTFAIVGGGP